MLLGSAATYGYDPFKLVRCDPLEFELHLLGAQAAAKHQGERDHALACMIISELAKALKRR